MVFLHWILHIKAIYLRMCHCICLYFNKSALFLIRIRALHSSLNFCSIYHFSQTPQFISLLALFMALKYSIKKLLYQNLLVAKIDIYIITKLCFWNKRTKSPKVKLHRTIKGIASIKLSRRINIIYCMWSVWHKMITFAFMYCKQCSP